LGATSTAAVLNDLLAPPVDDRLLARIVQRILARLPDACIVLFGSHAYGTPRPDSDVDLLVVTDQARQRPFALAGELYIRLRPRTLALDLVLMDRETLARRIRGFDPFLEEVTRKGRVLHGRLD
jgi:predicted nucleotidyltransferase